MRDRLKSLGSQGPGVQGMGSWYGRGQQGSKPKNPDSRGVVVMLGVGEGSVEEDRGS